MRKKPGPKPKPKETDEERVSRWVRGSVGRHNLTEAEREAAWKDVGNELILTMPDGTYYTRYFLRDRQPRYVVLEWDDSGDETLL